MQSHEGGRSAHHAGNPHLQVLTSMEIQSVCACAAERRAVVVLEGVTVTLLPGSGILFFY
jgi:hypothetical protein